MNVCSRLHVLPGNVSHKFVTALECFTDGPIVRIFICDDPATQICILCNHLAESIDGQPIHHPKANIATALNHAKHWRSFRSSAARIIATPVSRLASHVAFVNFNSALQLWRVNLSAYTVTNATKDK